MGLFDSLKKGVNTISPFSNAGGGDVTDLVPGIGDARAQKEANEQSISLDKMNRAWMERMSNSAYQRATEDMKKAGINPMLAYQQGGASVPSTSAPTVAAASKTGLASAAMGAFTGISGVNAARQNANTAQAQMESSVQLQQVQTAKTVAETQQTQADTKLKERELRGKGVKDTLDREGGKLIQNIIDGVFKSSSKPDPQGPLIKSHGTVPHSSGITDWLFKSKQQKGK